MELVATAKNRLMVADKFWKASPTISFIYSLCSGMVASDGFVHCYHLPVKAAGKSGNILYAVQQ
jgi:hypothetical protein